MAKLPCPPELWPAFSALLDQALEIPDGERLQWLGALGAEHAAVLPWLVKVVRTRAETLDARFLNAPWVRDAEYSEFRRGQNIGPYVLKERLGSGGMGEVWLASRGDGTLNRQVALKLPHAHLLAGVLRRRFERERDILAGLSHPHIAQLYDAGAADAEHPYLAMEWIDGVSIIEHCRAGRLSLQRRLDLFLQILDAVGHAHARLIAHRDLKPSNILVTRDGQVKLLDFGIAKLLAGDTQVDATQLTRIGSFIATPGYAAPEQLAGEPITVAVDLYALGVVLHELFSGRRPGRDPGPDGAATAFAPRASTRVDEHHARGVAGLSVRQLRRALRGDLDAVVAKALEADPLKRYRSAEAFARDIRLSRQQRPISARRIGPVALTMKFMRRHRLAVILSLGLLAVLIGGGAGIAWQALRAEREAQRATTIKDFLIGVFRASDPRLAANRPRGEITARQLLDVSAGRIDSSFRGQPLTQVELLGVTADIYRELDETRRSTALYGRETELASRYFGATDVHAIDGLLGQAYDADADGDDAGALHLLAQADPLIRRARLDHDAIRARWLLMHGEALFGDPSHAKDAAADLDAAVALFKAVAPKDVRYPDALIDLGSLFLDQSEFAASADFYRQALAVAANNRDVEGDLLLADAGLALALEYLGDFPGAAAAFNEGTQVAARTYGVDSHHYWMIASDWAEFRYERGEREAAFAAFDALLLRLPQAETTFRNATDAAEAALVLRKYGRSLANDGQGARAVSLLERARDLLKNSALHPPDAALLQLDLGTAYEAAGRIAEARDAFAMAVHTLEAQQAPPSQLASVHERRGRFLLNHGDSPGAAAEFDAALRLAGRHVKAAAVFAHAGLAALAMKWGDATTALDMSARAMAELDHIEGYYDIRVQPYVWRVRAQALHLAGDGAAARALAARAKDAALRYVSPGGEATR